jgi:hypothetical protein
MVHPKKNDVRAYSKRKQRELLASIDREYPKYRHRITTTGKLQRLYNKSWIPICCHGRVFGRCPICDDYHVKFPKIKRGRPPSRRSYRIFQYSGSDIEEEDDSSNIQMTEDDECEMVDRENCCTISVPPSTKISKPSTKISKRGSMTTDEYTIELLRWHQISQMWKEQVEIACREMKLVDRRNTVSGFTFHIYDSYISVGFCNMLFVLLNESKLLTGIVIQDILSTLEQQSCCLVFYMFGSDFLYWKNSPSRRNFFSCLHSFRSIRCNSERIQKKNEEDNSWIDTIFR